jgi:succinoglycan biosynthesis transport protein ExoP
MNNKALEQSPHLTEYYYILSKRRWIIIGSLLIMVSLTMLLTFIVPPVYQAATTLVIEKEQSTSPLTGERLDYESYLSQSLTFNTHFKLITSRPVLEKVIKNLGLDQLDREKGISTSQWKNLVSRVRKNIFLLLGKQEESLTAQERLSELSEKLREKIDVEEIRDTRLLRLRAEDHDPILATNLANELAKIYIEFNIANRLTYSQNTLNWMSDQLYEMKKRLEDAEADFLAYKQHEKIFSVSGKQKVIEQKIEEFNDAYIQARNRRLELEATLKQFTQHSQPSNIDIPYLRSLIDNPLIDNLYRQLLESEVERSRISKIFRSKHPKMIQIQTKIDDTRKKLNAEIAKEFKSLESERSVLLARENVLMNTISDFENEALETNKKELTYTILQRNVETNQKLYDTLLSKVKETNITGNIDASNIRIAEKAVMPIIPVKPKKILNLILSILFGLMTGIGLSFLLEYLDRSLHTEEDVQRYLGLPVLAIIPIADSEKRVKPKREEKEDVTPV